MTQAIRKRLMTWNSFLDGQKPGDVYVDEHGETFEVVAVSGPSLSQQALRRLRRAAFRINRVSNRS
jgi:hypothetical protein